MRTFFFVLVARRLRENDFSEDERLVESRLSFFLPSLDGVVHCSTLLVGSVGGEKNAKWKMFMFKMKRMASVNRLKLSILHLHEGSLDSGSLGNFRTTNNTLQVPPELSCVMQEHLRLIK